MSADLASKYGAIPASQFEGGQYPVAQQAPQMQGATTNKYGAIPAAQFESQQPKMQQSPAQPNRRAAFLQNLADKFQPINNVGLATSRGLSQGTYDVAKSFLNLAPDVLNSVGALANVQGEIPGMPKMDFREGISSDPLSQLAFVASDLGVQMGAGLKTYEGLSGIPALAGNGITKSIMRGGATGALLNDDGPGGRTIGGVIGAAAAPIFEMGDKRIAEDLANTRKYLTNLATEKYNTWFDKVKDSGINTMRVPTSINKEAIQTLPNANKYLYSFSNFERNPTFENAHKAQSDLGKMQRAIDDTSRKQKRGYTSPENDAITALNDARSKIHGAGMDALVKGGRPDLAEEYRGIKDWYKEELVPYFKKPLDEYMRNKVTASNMVNRMSKDRFFEKTAEKNHPELIAKKQYGNKAKNLAGKGAQGYALGVGAKMGLFGNNPENFIGSGSNDNG